MLSKHCPACDAPLVKYKGEIWCPICEKRVVIVKDDAEAYAVSLPYRLLEVEQIIVDKIVELARKAQSESDPESLKIIGENLDVWLSAFERIRKVRGK